MNDCKHYDEGFDCCNVLSDWSDGMPLLQPCIEGPCKAYGKRTLKIEIPCKIGDTVWAIRNYHRTKKVMSGTVSEMYFVGKEMRLCIVVHNIARGTWGIDIFPSQEEAEKRLIEWQTKKL